MEALPEIIRGKHVRLEPLTIEHLPGLCECLLNEPDGWFSRMYGLNSPQVLQRAVENRLAENLKGRSRSFVSIDLATSKIAGISHFLNIDRGNRQLEIGGTQVGKNFRRSYVNTETKYLMLAEAFEELKTVRVYFKVDFENLVSQKAILRIGAKIEGIARNDLILPDGRPRDCAIYSMIESEWSEIRSRFDRLLQNRSNYA